MSHVLETILRTEMVRYLIARAIFCPITGAVLDERTAVIVSDAETDPVMVLSPAGWAAIEADPAKLAALAARGYEKAA